MDRKEQEEKLPTLEIDPSTTYRPRPLWHRIVAFVLIGLIVDGSRPEKNARTASMRLMLPANTKKKTNVSSSG